MDEIDETVEMMSKIGEAIRAVEWVVKEATYEDLIEAIRTFSTRFRLRESSDQHFVELLETYREDGQEVRFLSLPQKLDQTFDVATTRFLMSIRDDEQYVWELYQCLTCLYFVRNDIECEWGNEDLTNEERFVQYLDHKVKEVEEEKHPNELFEGMGRVGGMDGPEQLI